MNRSPLGLFSVGCLLLIAPLVAVFGQEEVRTRQGFILQIGSSMDMNIEKNEQKLVTDTDLHYAWDKAEPLQRVLTLQQTGVRVMLNGQPTLNAVLNQNGTANVEGGKTRNVKVADAPAEVQSMLADSYGPPLCKLTVDANGLEIKRELINKPGAQGQIDNGMVSNCVLFHAPFYADKTTWERPIEMSMGNGGFAKGTLKYTRPTQYDPAAPELQVSGTATNEKFQPKNNPALTIVGAKYEISGEQAFDPVLQEWTSGTLTLKVSFKLVAQEKEIGTAQGTMVCKLKTQSN